ncbi:metal ABC transporter solute-binding protein, Zn/Mn family [Viscerimonas tarda]
MKHHILILSIIFTGLLSCNAPQQDKKETLSVSIEPQKFFLETIVGDKFRVNCVISSGSNPESFDPSPSQMVALSKSTAYFKVGHLSFENVWIKKVMDNNRSLSIVDCSEGIRIIAGNAVEQPAAKSHADTDPHIWSSPQTASVMAKNMYAAIVGLDPGNEESYTKNLNTLLAEFATTDSIIRLHLEKAPVKSFLIFHPALSYFANEYGLQQYSIEYESKSPTPAQLKQLIDRAKQNNIRVVFIQKEYDRKNAETIAKEIDATVVPIDLLSYRWSEQLIMIAKSLALENE